ncbi:MAG: saccharopine dehydrogenase C-terminal domain-containing protein [Thermoplasmata archaeon]
MKVVQIGCGVCGLVCAEHLAKNPKVNELVLADLKTAPAEALAKRLKKNKIVVEKANGTDPGVLKSLLKDADLVIASMPWRLNRIILDTAAKLGCDYLDFGMPFDSTIEPDYRRYDKIVKDAGIRALIGMGMEPGTSDVFAMHAAKKLDRADEAHVYDGDSSSVEGIEFFSTWSPVDMFDETSVPAAVFRNGKIEFIPPLSSKEYFDFPEPLGRLPVYKTNHDETYFLPMGIKTLKHASFNIFIDDAFAQAATIFRKYGLLGTQPIDVKGTKIVPRDVVVALTPEPMKFADKIKGDAGFVVEVIGVKDGKKTKVRVWTMTNYEEVYRRHRSNATGYMVGTGGAVSAEMLMDGEVKGKGFVIPEYLDTESYLDRLKKKDIVVYEEMSEVP